MNIIINIKRPNQIHFIDQIISLRNYKEMQIKHISIVFYYGLDQVYTLDLKIIENCIAITINKVSRHSEIRNM